jgi:hypothetical protein
MKIEMNKSYSVSPKWKKSWIDNEFLTNDKGVIIELSTLWRSGSCVITPVNEDEVEMLTDAINNTDGDEFYPQEFEDYEFVETWDGISEDLTFGGESISEDEQKRLIEGWDEDRYSFLEDMEGFYTDDSECILIGELDITEEGDV